MANKVIREIARQAVRPLEDALRTIASDLQYLSASLKDTSIYNSFADTYCFDARQDPNQSRKQDPSRQ